MMWLRMLEVTPIVFFSSRRRHTIFKCDWSSDVCSSDLVYSARFKDEALAQVCPGPVSSAGETVDVSAACTALQAWDGTGTAASRGSHVWDEFWKRVASQIKSADLYAVPFDAADPVNTPRGIKPTAKAALQKAFAEAVKAVQASGFAMDAA